MLLTLLILLVVGAVASNFAGRKLVQWATPWCTASPVVRSIYPASSRFPIPCFLKAVTLFRTAVLVQWPREGVWTVAFVTGAPERRNCRVPA